MAADTDQIIVQLLENLRAGVDEVRDSVHRIEVSNAALQKDVERNRESVVNLEKRLSVMEALVPSIGSAIEKLVPPLVKMMENQCK